MADATPLTGKQVDQIMVIYADGTNRIIDGPALSQFLEWLTAVQAVLAAAKTLAPISQQEAPSWQPAPATPSIRPTNSKH